MSQELKPCAQEIFDKGRSVWLGDIPKHTAEDICFAVSAVTGWKFDWHYIGGRVHVKALAPIPLAGGNSHVEARQCDACNHVGINDSAAGLGACHDCDWQGSDPVADECPGCRNQNCMAAACPKCGARYALIADATLATPVPPAGGEVAVLCTLDRHAQGGATFSEDAFSFGMHGTELVDRDHVTRLQAENAALQQRLNVADQRVDDLETEREALKAKLHKANLSSHNLAHGNANLHTELEKARYNECLSCADDAEALGADAVAAYLREWAERKRPVSSQSAPAACWTPANHECPGDGVGACKKCQNAPAEKGEGDE